MQKGSMSTHTLAPRRRASAGELAMDRGFEDAGAARPHDPHRAGENGVDPLAAAGAVGGDEDLREGDRRRQRAGRKPTDVQ